MLKTTIQDHFSVTTGAELRGYHETVDDMASPTFAEEKLRQYRQSKSGMLSSTLSTFVFIPARAFMSDDAMKTMMTSLDRALQDPVIQNSPWKKVYDLQRSWLEKDGVAQLEMILFPCELTHITPPSCAEGL